MDVYIYIIILIIYNSLNFVKSLDCYLSSSSSTQFINNECGCYGKVPQCNNIEQIDKRIKYLNTTISSDNLNIYIDSNIYYVQDGNRLDYDSFLLFRKVTITSQYTKSYPIFDGTGANSSLISNFNSIVNHSTFNLDISYIQFTNWNTFNGDYNEPIIKIEPTQQQKLNINLNNILISNSSYIISVKNNQIDSGNSSIVFLQNCEFNQINSPSTSTLSNRSPLEFTNILNLYFNNNNFRNSTLESSFIKASSTNIQSAHILNFDKFTVENIQIKDILHSFININSTYLSIGSGRFSNNIGSLISYYGERDVTGTTYSQIYSVDVAFENNYFESPSLINIASQELNKTNPASYFFLARFYNNTFNKPASALSDLTQSLITIESSLIKFENTAIDNLDSDIFFVDNSYLYLDNSSIPSRNLAFGKNTNIYIRNSTIAKDLTISGCDSCKFIYGSDNNNIPTSLWKTLISIVVISGVSIVFFIAVVVCLIVIKKRLNREDKYIKLNQVDQDLNENQIEEL